MNKASCLILVSNAILYWNTPRISNIFDGFKAQGGNIQNETMKHISLLSYKHILPNETYFIEEDEELNIG